MVPDAVRISAEAVFWVGSTVAQCLVAILAFGAFVVSWRIDGFRDSVVENFVAVRDKVKEILEQDIQELNKNGVNKRVDDFLREHKKYATWVRTGNPRTEFSGRYLLNRYRHAVMKDAAQFIAWEQEIDAIATGNLRAHFEILKRHYQFCDEVLKQTDLIRGRLRRLSYAGLLGFAAPILIVAWAKILAGNETLGTVVLSVYSSVIVWSFIETSLVATGAFWEPRALREAVEGDAAQRA